MTELPHKLPETSLAGTKLRNFIPLHEKWFWYSIASAFCWTGWAFTARFGSKALPANMMEFVSAFGFLAFGILLLAIRGFRIETNRRGVIYGIGSGILLGGGGLALYAAYRVGTNTVVVTTATSLYPIFTVLLAVVFLKERLSKKQILGILFAGAAIVLFSL